MKKMMYLAAQYLAAAGISFVKKEEDDSHTNLFFDINDACLKTRPLNPNGDILSVNYKNFTLEFHSGSKSTPLSLDGSTHADVLHWIKQITSHFANPYIYNFHYKPTYPIENDFTFKLLNDDRLKELKDLRTLAQSTLVSFLKNHNLKSEIRVWPHHFDTGAYTMLNDNFALGLGFAVPDSLVNEHYFYISGNKGHLAVNTSTFDPLTLGKWINNEFKGAILPASKLTEKMTLSFLNEAYTTYNS